VEHNIGERFGSKAVCSTTFTGELEEAIKKDFGSLDNLKAQLSAVSVGVQGSGWGWLGYNKQTKRLQLAACANQDPLEATTG
jgi:Fe-Mn family superoxide dismutase